MKIFFYLLCLIIVPLAGCVRSKVSQPEDIREYFVRPCEFVCDYPFNDTTKWAITCRVWGLLKYYHPNVTAGKLDWDKILLDMTEDIFYSSTPEMVNAELKKMLDAAGKYKSKKDDNRNDSLNMNLNLCWMDHSFLDKALQDELKEIASQTVKLPSYYGVDFDSDGHPIAQHEKVDYNIDSRKHRLLALFRFWNVIYYFSPHKYLMDLSWDRTLSESVFPFINATDKQSYKIALLKLAASLNDGHAYASIANYYPNESSDLVEKVTGKTVVKIDRGGLRRGDIVNHIGGRDIDRIRDSLSVLIPASTQGNKEYRINCYVAEMIFFHETDIGVSRNGQKLELHLLPVPFEKKPLHPYEKISDSIGYVDLSLLTTGEIDLMFQSFSDVKGIIFDLRKLTGRDEYDRGLLYCHLSKQKKFRLFPMVFFDQEHPGTYFFGKDIIVDVTSDNRECIHFEGKIVFLINECTQSSTETVAWVVRTNYHAPLIGRPTSGTLGQIVWVFLPESNVAFSGFGLLSLDGTELQRKGIIPDIEVYPTMESIREGKDEILEAAIEYLNKM